MASMIAARHVDKFLYLGDVYESGSSGDYAQTYDPSYGLLKAITAPTPGNYEWIPRAGGYNPYWAAVHGSAPPSYYSFRVGRWQFLDLNSEDPHGQPSPSARLAAGSNRGDATVRNLSHRLLAPPSLYGGNESHHW